MKWRFWRRRDQEQELEAEINAHLEMEIRQRMERGESEQEARRGARRDFGNIALVKETVRRQASGWRLMERFEQDARYAARFTAKKFRQEILLSLVTVLTLALAIAANTALFTWTNALVFKKRPGVGKAEELAHFGRTINGKGFDTNFSYPSFLDYRNNNTVFSGVVAYQDSAIGGGRLADGPVQVLYSSAVSGDFFDLLQVKPAAGRLLTRDDDQTGAVSVAVISYRMWQTSFASSPGISGNRITIDGRLFNIVGVAPEGFTGVAPVRTDVWFPLAAHPDPVRFNTRSHSWLAITGRLKPGISVQQAQASLDALSVRLEKEYPDSNKGVGVRLASDTIMAQDGVTLTLTLVWAVPLIILLIACANVAGIGLMRGSARRKEIAVRLVLGASRRRVICQLLTESLITFTVAAAAAAILSPSLLGILIRVMPDSDVLLSIDTSLDWRVIGFTLLLTFFSALVSGLTPAFQATRHDVSVALKEESTTATTYRRLRLRSGLVAGQVAMSLVLLIGGALFLQSLRRLSENLGFDPDDLHVASFDLATGGFTAAEGNPFLAELLQRASALPGIESAGLGRYLPMDGGTWNERILVPGYTETGRPALVNHNAVSPDYFKTMKVPVLKGREFMGTDQPSSPRVAVVSQSAARRFWPGTDPIGKHFYDCDRMFAACDTEVIGVVADIRDYNIEKGQLDSFVYRPLSQARYFPQVSLVFRSSQPDASVPAVRRLVGEINANLPILRMQTMRDALGRGLFIQRFAAWFAGAMGIVGLLLASLGIYSVTAYGVTCRRREIGIRTALGAGSRNIICLMLREGLLLTVIGLLLGCGGSIALTRLLTAALYGITPTDAATFSMTSIAVTLIGLSASYLPARRAARLDPIVALRQE